MTTQTTPASANESYNPYIHFTRDQWDNLVDRTPLPLTDADIERIAGFGDPIDMREVDVIYRPLSALLQLSVDGRRQVTKERRDFLSMPGVQPPADTPFIIGVAGSVAVGKSTVARLLRLLLSRWESTPRVDLVTTDGFLLPNKVLEDRGIMARKGFPESYDQQRLIDFLSQIKAGNPCVTAPVYSHVVYDIVPDQFITVSRPDILIVEGLNVLQPPCGSSPVSSLSPSDFLDFSIYVDADEHDIEEWYVSRFLGLRDTAFTREDSFFRTYATLSDSEAQSTARMIWHAINKPNLHEYIEPTKPRASMIFTKGSDHRVQDLYLRQD